MIHLLDVNVVIALLDTRHVAHEIAQTWFEAIGRHGYATCPIVQNGFLRIAASKSYAAQPAPLPDLMATLDVLCDPPAHQFWPEDFSLLDELVIDRSRLRGPETLTDAYLIALASKRGGRLATLDRRMSEDMVVGGRGVVTMIAPGTGASPRLSPQSPSS